MHLYTTQVTVKSESVHIRVENSSGFERPHSLPKAPIIVLHIILTLLDNHLSDTKTQLSQNRNGKGENSSPL